MYKNMKIKKIGKIISFELLEGPRFQETLHLIGMCNIS